VLNRADKVEELEKVSSKLFQTNVVGNIHLFNLFLPLVMKGKVKKVIAISSGHGDLDFINDLEVENSALYAASKAAMNVVVAKFNAQYKKDGVLFVSLSPGIVEVGHFDNGKSFRSAKTSFF
jgi:NAD(P)-dependent dehydrogenase (short-subunit alcohol dehydrogenase family)